MSGRIAALEFALGFEGCPAEITGAEGAVKTFNVLATLTSTGDDSPNGAQAWSISIEAIGGRITAITVDGLHVSTIFDHDGNPATPPLDPYEFDLAGAAFKSSGLARHESDPARLGAISAVALSFNQSALVLQPRGTARIARLTVEATVPADVTLRFENGFVGGGAPVNNQVTHQGGPQVPSLGSCTIPLSSSDCTGTPESPDCNADGVADECQLSGNDCDQNGIPDECDPDCDGNAFPDACDIALGSPDCNANGVPDSCDIAAGTDCDYNGVPDSCDLSSGALSDDDGNGIPDECESCPPPKPVECSPGGPPLFRYSFQGPCSLCGVPGESRRFRVVGLIETHCAAPGEPGADAWNFDFTVEGCRIIGATFENTDAALETEGGLRLEDGFALIRPIDPARNKGQVGFVTAVRLSQHSPASLDPAGSPHSVIAVTLEATIPEGPEFSECRLRFVDGLIPSFGGRNQVIRQGRTELPELGEMTVRLYPCPSPSFLRGDCDSDGEVRGVVTDAIFLLNWLFLGGQAPTCLAACDANGDGAVVGVVTDPIYILTYNFLGGSAPPAPFPSCGGGGEADTALGCETASESCGGLGQNP
jgi:hypothetical protein